MNTNPDEALALLEDLIEHYERFPGFGLDSFPLSQLYYKVRCLQEVSPIKLAPPGFILPGIPVGGDNPDHYKFGTVSLDFLWEQIDKIGEQLGLSG